jgi:hypothetical protein
MPNNHYVEIVLHVDETLGEDRQRELVTGLEGHPGVESAQFTPGRPHLVRVDYDPEQISSQTVLSYVQREHVHAELVGPA